MTVGLPPASGYGRCPCGGVYEQRVVEVRMTIGGEVVILVDVPQGACPICGSRVYKAGTLEGIEALMGGQPAPLPRALL
jgi:YgiT-type zinc finger domain-containing protein